MKKSGYAGRIKNSGTQYVEAPMKPGAGSGKGIVHKGGDLRTNAGKGRK